MNDYGLKISKKGISATKTDDLSDLIMVTRYPLAKIDSTTSDSFKTISTTFLSTPASGVETEIYRFTHPYDYVPQAWGLWNVEYPDTATWVSYDQAYGTYLSGIAAGTHNLLARYEVIDSEVILYATATDGIIGNIDVTGFILKLTIYIFADDLSAQDYTTDD